MDSTSQGSGGSSPRGDSRPITAVGLPEDGDWSPPLTARSGISSRAPSGGGGVLAFRTRASGSRPSRPETPSSPGDGQGERTKTPFLSFGRQSSASQDQTTLLEESEAAPSPGSRGGAESPGSRPATGASGRPDTSASGRPGTSASGMGRGGGFNPLKGFRAAAAAVRGAVALSKKSKKAAQSEEKRGITREEHEAQALAQAEAGILSEVFREARLGWQLDRGGVHDEIQLNFTRVLKRSAALFENVDFDYSAPEPAAKRVGTGGADGEPVGVEGALGDEDRPQSAPRKAQDRYVRCFVSASTADMQAERRLLAQEVFPTLRLRCMQLGVHFVEVDFGWGVPEHIAERKSVVMTRLLELRQNVKTYLVGVVGERYGYTYALDASPGYGALDPLYSGKRVAVLGLQEVELDEGALSRDIDVQCFYYCRDSSFLSTIDEREERAPLQSEGVLSRERLSHLKSKLRLSGVIIRDNYSGPEQFADWVLKDLTARIVADFPEETSADALAHVDEMITCEYEDAMLLTFQGREADMNRLDELVLGLQSTPQPTLVMGHEGVGKSAFMVAWSTRFKQKQQVEFFFRHYAGLNNQSRPCSTIMRSILNNIKEHFGLRKEIPAETALLAGSLQLWLNILAGLNARVVIMIDAADRVTDTQMEHEAPIFEWDDEEEVQEAAKFEDGPEDKPHSLSWLPTAVPPNVRLVVSCTESTPAASLLQSRKWNTLTLEPLDYEAKTNLMQQWTKTRGLAMSEGVKERLFGRGISGNPLYLTTVMRALVVPNDMKPSGSLGNYMFVRSIDELAEAAMSRLEQTRALQERVGLVEEVMCAVAMSRRGLSEMEILQMVQVPRAVFSSFYTETRQVFKILFGLMTFAYAAFERVVRRRYLTSVEVRIMIRRNIAEFFQSKPVSHRLVHASPSTPRPTLICAL
jgi:hypothetical protein